MVSCGGVDLVALSFVVVGIPHPIRPVVKKSTLIVVVITGLEKKQLKNLNKARLSPQGQELFKSFFAKLKQNYT